ncbi:MAG: hypothetical protein P4L64_04925 [Caulobacteraceae bacterium]|nr:hypothetical protein [Caulobacteraceae bacterium]
MSIKSTVLAGAALLALAVPAAAMADPYWDRDGDGGRHEWREHQWREHEWREHEAWEHRGEGWRWGYAPHCFIENRGYYTWYGEYEYRPVRVCR